MLPRWRSPVHQACPNTPCMERTTRGRTQAPPYETQSIPRSVGLMCAFVPSEAAGQYLDQRLCDLDRKGLACTQQCRSESQPHVAWANPFFASTYTQTKRDETFEMWSRNPAPKGRGRDNQIRRPTRDRHPRPALHNAQYAAIMPARFWLNV